MYVRYISIVLSILVFSWGTCFHTLKASENPLVFYERFRDEFYSKSHTRQGAENNQELVENFTNHLISTSKILRDQNIKVKYKSILGISALRKSKILKEKEDKETSCLPVMLDSLKNSLFSKQLYVSWQKMDNFDLAFLQAVAWNNLSIQQTFNSFTEKSKPEINSNTLLLGFQDFQSIFWIRTISPSLWLAKSQQEIKKIGSNLLSSAERVWGEQTEIFWPGQTYKKAVNDLYCYPREIDEGEPLPYVFYEKKAVLDNLLVSAQNGNPLALYHLVKILEIFVEDSEHQELAEVYTALRFGLNDYYKRIKNIFVKNLGGLPVNFSYVDAGLLADYYYDSAACRQFYEKAISLNKEPQRSIASSRLLSLEKSKTLEIKRKLEQDSMIYKRANLKLVSYAETNEEKENYFKQACEAGIAGAYYEYSLFLKRRGRADEAQEQTELFREATSTMFSVIAEGGNREASEKTTFGYLVEKLNDFKQIDGYFSSVNGQLQKRN